MFVLHTDGTPYANTSVTVSYFDINQFPIGSVTGTTNSAGYLQVRSPQFRKQDHAAGVPRGDRRRRYSQLGRHADAVGRQALTR